MLLNVNVETVGDVGAFTVHGNQFVIPGRYIVFERSVEKETNNMCLLRTKNENRFERCQISLQSIDFLGMMIELKPVSCFERYTLPVQAQLQVPRVAVFNIDESISRYDVAQWFAGSHRYLL